MPFYKLARFIAVDAHKQDVVVSYTSLVLKSFIYEIQSNMVTVYNLHALKHIGQ